MIQADDNLNRNHANRYACYLLIIAFVVRLIAAFVVTNYVDGQGRDFVIEGDANGYWQLAEKIVAGQDYAIHQPPRYVLRTPGFPLFLAATMRIHQSHLVARIALAAIGAACCWLTFRLGRQLIDERTGLIAAALVAFHPLHIGNSVLILSETLFTFFMLISLCGLAAILRSSDHRPKNSIFTGIAIGVAVLVRPGFLPWIVPATLAAMFLSNSSDQPLARKLVAGMLIFGCLIPLQPWAWRNQSVTGHYILTSLWSGPSMYDGLNENADGSSDMTFFDREKVMTEMSEFEMNQHYQQRAIRFALQNPGRAAELGWKKVGRFLSPYPNLLSEKENSGFTVLAKVACSLLWAMLFLPAIYAVFRGFMDLKTLVLTLGPLLLFAAIHLVFVGSVRYRFPVEFPLAIASARAFTFQRNDFEAHSFEKNDEA